MGTPFWITHDPEYSPIMCKDHLATSGDCLLIKPELFGKSQWPWTSVGRRLKLFIEQQIHCYKACSLKYFGIQSAEQGRGSLSCPGPGSWATHQMMNVPLCLLRMSPETSCVLPLLSRSKTSFVGLHCSSTPTFFELQTYTDHWI